MKYLKTYEDQISNTEHRFPEPKYKKGELVRRKGLKSIFKVYEYDLIRDKYVLHRYKDKTYYGSVGEKDLEPLSDLEIAIMKYNL